jgi:threonylcarbamoyladenosine tRNA methylthiotransferase MtaB
MIAGFPTETEDMFKDTLDFVRETALPYLHVFPYSERPDTPAARMPAVPVAVRRDRAARLREAGAASAAAFHATLIGHEAHILAETEQGGHTEHFAPVRVQGVPGHLLRARITEADARGLVAIAA